MLTTEQAAAVLHVSAAEVRRLVRDGELPATSAGRMLLLDDAPVRRRARLAGRGRPLDPAVAWAALWELSGERADWVGQRTRTRLRSWFDGRSPEAVATACRRRAEVHEVRVLPTYRGAVLGHAGVVASGLTAAGEVGADVVAWGENVAVAYCGREVLETLERRYGLSGRGAPNLSLRVPRLEDWTPLVARRAMPVAVVAVDLLEDDDVRTRRAGADLLSRCLEEYLR